MIGGGLGRFAPGEWTDDTSQTYAVAAVAATGADLRTDGALDQVARGLADWFAAGATRRRQPDPTRPARRRPPGQRARR